MLEMLLMNWVPLLVIGAGVLLPIVAVIARGIQQSIDSSRQSRADDQRAETERELIRLKQGMVDRGMSAADMERILNSGRST